MKQFTSRLANKFDLLRCNPDVGGVEAEWRPSGGMVVNCPKEMCCVEFWQETDSETDPQYYLTFTSIAFYWLKVFLN